MIFTCKICDNKLHCFDDYDMDIDLACDKCGTKYTVRIDCIEEPKVLK